MQADLWGPQDDGDGWTFPLWAPRAGSVALRTGGASHPMTRDARGLWRIRRTARPGDTYLFEVDGLVMPDPASRLQAGGVEAPSVLTRPDPPPPWPGRPWHEAVIYELHVGCFTPEGTLNAAAARLSGLADLGITAIQLMPLGQFPGRRGWGYDGVLPFAVHPAYGTPDDLRDFVETAHRAGLMVLLDVVMNHFGPRGAWLHHAAPDFFDHGRHTPWGAAIDFSRPEVRAYWTECALYWMRDMGMDGLRLDAVHQITGPGAEDFLIGLADRAAALTPPRHLVTEDDRNLPDLREAGYAASWNDDFHHAVHVALTAEDDAYYAPFACDPVGDLAHALGRGHVEEGQPRPPRAALRGADCSHLPPTAFVNATQTHDQVGNRAFGERLLTLADPDGVRVAFALLLVAPFIPMIFMGEERGETRPFQFFADYEAELGRAIREGRAAEFPSIAARGDTVPDPLDPATMRASTLSWAGCDDPQAGGWLDLTRRALRFRADHVVPMLAAGGVTAEVSRDGPGLVRARWRSAGGGVALSLALNQRDPAPLADADLVVGDARGPFSLNVKALT